MKSVLDQAREIVIPSTKTVKLQQETAQNALERVIKETKKNPEIVDVEFAGSFAKGTWVDGGDIDILIKFNKDIVKKKFIQISQKIGFNAFKDCKPYVKYSEHPYVEVVFNSIKINIVPSYDVTQDKWMSATDRTHFHTKFMLKSLSEIMKDDVRLLKYFLQSNGIYGSEIAKQGFSGYLSEVLIWNFGSFENTIKKCSKLQPQQVIGKANKKFDTIITITDPIDYNRNLVAAVSNRNIGKFVLVCRQFQKNPSIKFFKSSVLKLDKINQKNTIIVKFHFSSRGPDTIWGQIKRASSAISKQLQEHGFKVIRYAASTDEIDEAVLVFLVDSLVISNFYVKTGPEFFNEIASTKFIQKNSKQLMWINDDKNICCIEKRRYTDVKKLLRYLITDKSTSSGIPQGIKLDLKKFQILSATQTSSKSIKKALHDILSTDEKIFSNS